MSGQEEPQYRKNKAEAEQKWKESKDDSYRQEIISALKGLRDNFAAYQKKAETKDSRDRRIENLRFRRERKRYRLDCTGVIAAIVVAGLFLIQDGALIITIIDGRHAADTAHWDNLKAQRQTRDFFQDAQAPVLWAPYEKEGGPRWLPSSSAADRSKGLGGIAWTLGLKNFGTGTAFGKAGVVSDMKIRGVTCHSSGIVQNDYIVPSGDTESINGECLSWKLTKRDFKKLLLEFGAVTIFVHLRYFDIFGTEYETDICEATGEGAGHMCEGTTYKRMRNGAKGPH